MKITKEHLKALIKEELSKSPLNSPLQFEELKLGDKIEILIPPARTPAPATVSRYFGGWLYFYWDSSQISSKIQTMQIEDALRKGSQFSLIQRAR